MPLALERRPHRAGLCLMLASGFAGLGYQMVWTQQCALWLGHESASVLAVVSAFFGGMALGALWMGPRIERSENPLRWYVACELAMAAWGLSLLVLMPWLSGWVQVLMGEQPSALRQWSLAFAGTFLTLLPATLAMGATMPAMERVVGALRQESRSVAGLYAFNTLGAVLGVLLATFALVPGLGLARTVLVCVGLNLLCAVVAHQALPRHAPAPQFVSGAARRDQRVLWALALTGLLGIGHEVMVVRVLSQVAEDTVYTFAMLLTVYLIGTSLGAAAYPRWLERWLRQGQPVEALDAQLFGLLAAACLVGTGSLWWADRVLQAVRQALGGSVGAAVLAEACLAVLAFALPTFVMGTLFSHLSQRALSSGHSFGRALGVNTLGAALAAPLFGVWLTPWLGTKLVLILIAAAYLLLAVRQAWASPWIWAPGWLALGMVWLAPPLVFVEMPEGGHIVSYREGVMAAVSVVEDGDGVARLRINNRQQEGSTSTRFVDSRQALLPMLLHPAPHRALFLGLGTGVTSGSAAEEPGLRVDAVELLPEVIESATHFRRVFDDPSPKPSLNVIAADARRYVRVSPSSYDLIVSDNFQPARSGSGSLYTVEHFQAVKARLAPQGVFCQWLPLHQMDLQTLRSIVQSFLQAYPGAVAMLASNSLETPVVGLVGRQDDASFDPARLRSRMAHLVLPQPLAAYGLDDEWAVLGSVIAGPQALARFAGDARANTDDLPVVAYLAPRATYAPEDLPRDRLATLLQVWSASPSEVVVGGVDPAWAQRLAHYWQARNQFILAGRGVRPTDDVREMLAQVQGPLLAVLQTSADFRPAYAPLVRMAQALQAQDPAAAQSLLQQLRALQSPVR